MNTLQESKVVSYVGETGIRQGQRRGGDEEAIKAV